MKLLVLTNGYPSESDLYRNGFVHRRIKEYIKSKSCEVNVFVFNNSINNEEKYFYDGVKVINGNSEVLKQYIDCNCPDKLLIHFINIPMMESIEKIRFKNNILIWIHGVEGLAWYRRLFNINIKEFHKYIYNNIKHRKKFREFIKKHNKQIHFIFVSKWMESIFKKDVYSKKINSSIIHNVIDDDLFGYSEKEVNLRKNILLIRPFSSKKYANDIAIKAILELSKNPKFSDMKFTIVGKGKYFRKLTQPLSNYPNIFLINEFLSQNNIAKLHKENGLFLCPTRQDSQGVSMCEAMSSGLIPITSNCTAIPEFVDESSGILTNNVLDISKAILKIYDNPNEFKNLSYGASKNIRLKCGLNATISKELELLLQNEKQNN